MPSRRRSSSVVLAIGRSPPGTEVTVTATEPPGGTVSGSTTSSTAPEPLEQPAWAMAQAPRTAMTARPRTRPKLHQVQGGPGLALGQVDAPEHLDGHVAEPGQRLAVGALHRARVAGPGGQHHGAHLEAGRARGLERQQRVVDRAQ